MMVVFHQMMRGLNSKMRIIKYLCLFVIWYRNFYDQVIEETNIVVLDHPPSKKLTLYR